MQGQALGCELRAGGLQRLSTAEEGEWAKWGAGTSAESPPGPGPISRPHFLTRQDTGRQTASLGLCAVYEGHAAHPLPGMWGVAVMPSGPWRAASEMGMCVSPREKQAAVFAQQVESGHVQ